MEKILTQNPDPVIRISNDGEINWANKAASILLQEWGIENGERVPEVVRNSIKKVLSGNSPEKIEIKVREKIFLVTFLPFPEIKQVITTWFDTTSQRKLQAKLRVKEKQHDTLREIATLAFRSESLQGFMNESVKLLAETLDIEYTKILELQPDGNFLLKAGTGWATDFLGKISINGSKTLQAGYTLFSKTSVVVTDFKKEERFKGSALLKEHEVTSGISVIIGKPEKPYGILSAHSKKPRKFTVDDVYFLNAVAFLISEVIERRKAEEELYCYKEQLEKLVEERTAELTKTNEHLCLEIAGRKKIEKALQNNIYFLEILLDAIPSPVFYRNLDGVYQGCNKAFARHILGLDKKEVLGHSMCEFKNHFSEETVDTSVYFDGLLLKLGKSLPHELRIKCAINGQEKDFLTHKATYSNLSGEIIGIVGVMLDITERKRAEEALLRTEEIRKKEIHHRIKNNLQVISSLLSLEADHFTDKRVKESFQESQNRVISMSLIHEELYRTEETGDVETFDFKAYIQKLANELFSSYIVGEEEISLKLDIEKIFFGMDSGIPLGIIINELVSNSLKHAFKERKNREIQISLHRIDNSGIEGSTKASANPDIPEEREFLLVVSDNGVGFPEDLDFKHTSSLGLQLVNILVEQLEGSIELGKGPGTEFRLNFREKLTESYQEKKQ